MSDLRKAAQTALDNAELMNDEHVDRYYNDMSDEQVVLYYKDILALRAVLAQPDESFCDTHCTWHQHHPNCFMARTEKGPEPEPEPVAYQWLGTSVIRKHIPKGAEADAWTPLYLAPPQRKPLTESEIDYAYQQIWRERPDNTPTTFDWIEAGIRYAEKAHGIGENK